VKEYIDRKVEHPDFGYILVVGFEGRPVVIFKRNDREDPTPEQVEKYEAKRKIVEANDGVMRHPLFMEGKEIPAYKSADVAAMITAVKRDLPDYEVVSSWNGVNCHTFSVSIRKKVLARRQRTS